MSRHFATLRDANARLNACRNTVVDLSGQSDGASSQVKSSGVGGGWGGVGCGSMDGFVWGAM